MSGKLPLPHDSTDTSTGSLDSRCRAELIRNGHVLPSGILQSAADRLAPNQRDHEATFSLFRRRRAGRGGV